MSFRAWFFLRQCRGCFLNHKSFAVRRTAQKCSIVQGLRFCHTIETNISSDVKSKLVVDVKHLTNGDETLEKKLKVLMLEVDIWRQEGERIPSEIRDDDWKELLNLKSRNARKKYLLFCFKREMSKRNDKIKKDMKREQRNEMEVKRKGVFDPLDYSLGNNTIFLRLRDSTVNDFLNWKLVQAMLFSQKLVVDCGYESFMSTREARNCGKQLMYLFSVNRFHTDPFDLYFCNAQRGKGSMYDFEKIVTTAFEPHFPLNITEKSYLDLFPKENLVYLTPHCREELLHFDHDAVYIIGGLVDKVNNEPLSLARAKEQDLKMAKLPLDRFLAWNSGSGKSLTLNQMIMILLDIRQTGDWKKALRHVPKRKVQKMYQVDYSADRFKFSGIDLRMQPKDVYNQLIHKKVKKKA